MAVKLNPVDMAKFIAAKRATAFVEDGMKLGLGTGSTAAWMVRCLAERIRSEGLRVTGVRHVWVLDDGRRPEIKALCADLGARYLVREDNRHAKAGNINAALPQMDADLLLFLDADHVPQRSAIQQMSGKGVISMEELRQQLGEAVPDAMRMLAPYRRWR